MSGSLLGIIFNHGFSLLLFGGDAGGGRGEDLMVYVSWFVYSFVLLLGVFVKPFSWLNRLLVVFQSVSLSFSFIFCKEQQC